MLSMNTSVSGEKIKKQNMALITFKRMCRNKLSIAGLVIIVFFIVVAIFAPMIATHDYTEVNLLEKFTAPCAEHLFGTDELGRDLFSRVVFGTRLSLYIGLMGVIASSIAGVIIGSISGYFGGIVDTVLMRILDVLAGIPAMVLAIAICAALGSGINNCILALSIATVPSVARLVRASILNVRGMDYIEAAQSINCTNPRIIIHHVLPNAFSPLLVNMTMNYAFFVLTAAGLSFVGLGVQPPAAEWGALISAARSYTRSYPYLIIIPGIALVLLVLAFNMVGDGLRDALDPKLKD